MPILGVVSGVTYLSVATDPQPMASIGGCPSTAFPLPAGSTVDEQAGLVSDWPPRTLGCWTPTSEIGTEAAAFAFYMEPPNTPGWTLVYAYSQTRAARFSSVTHRGLFADVSVDSVRLIGHSKTRLDLSVRSCATPHANLRVRPGEASGRPPRASGRPNLKTGGEGEICLRQTLRHATG